MRGNISFQENQSILNYLRDIFEGINKTVLGNFWGDHLKISQFFSIKDFKRPVIFLSESH